MTIWTHDLGNVSIMKLDGMDRTFGAKWASCDSQIRKTLEKAITLAPEMGRCSMDAIRLYGLFLGDFATNGRQYRVSTSTETSEVGDGLCKYFELHKTMRQPGNWDLPRWLNGMITVYDYVARG